MVKRRVFDIIQIGNKQDVPSAAFDLFIVATICINLFITLFETFDASEKYMGALRIVEFVTIVVFIIEYILRVWTAQYLYPNLNSVAAKGRFIVSFYGLIDLLTIVPYFLPFIFASGAVAFRIFRVIRIFRLFKINSQYDAFNVIVNVLNEKKTQIFSSICMICILMVASSLCMYSLEHEAQPEQFSNAFSGIWWSMSTLLTVGYGDIYPVTTAGKLMAIIIAFLGVGMVAIPTGIISAGFVEQYTKLKESDGEGSIHDVKYIASVVNNGHNWCNKKIKDIVLPPQTMIVSIRRGTETIKPLKDTVVKEDDILLIVGKNIVANKTVTVREVRVGENINWDGIRVDELDISRLETVVVIRRGNNTMYPEGDTVLKSGDSVLICARHKVTELNDKEFFFE